MLAVGPLIAFLAGLEENNHRAWFAMNKPGYDILRAEFIELVEAVIQRVGRFDPPIAEVDPRKALFRLNRDLRFSADPRPYKTWFSAALSADGKKSQGPMYYFHIDAAGKLFTAAGCYRPEPVLLKSIRQHIVNRPDLLTQLLADKNFIGARQGLANDDQLQRLPKGFGPDTPHADIVRLKSFVVRNERSLLERAPRVLAQAIASDFEKMAPLVRWLRSAL